MFSSEQASGELVITRSVESDMYITRETGSAAAISELVTVKVKLQKQEDLPITLILKIQERALRNFRQIAII